MQERLVIKNFGPIKSVDLELGKMTILIGDNATGKSTIAKVLSVCKYFDYIIPFKNNINGEYTNFIKGLNIYNIKEFLQNDSNIYYENDLYKLSINTDTEFNPKVTTKDNSFQELFQLSEEIFVDNESYPQKFYDEFVSKVMNKPCFIPVERVLQGLSFNKDLLLSEAVQDQLRKLERFAINYGSMPKSLNVLDLEFKRDGNRNYIKKKSDTEFFPISIAASGFQNATSIALAIGYYNLFKKKPKTFIIEEPEISLFPKSQKKLVEFFVQNINENKHQFILPTHSPYILSALNNCLYAHTVGNLNNQKYKDQAIKIKPENQWLNPECFSTYYLENGTCIDIFDKEENLINTDYIDSVSREINKEFDELVTIEMQDEN